MSYILDALKKSDRERQQGEVPGLDSIHDRFPSPGSRSPSPLKKTFFMAASIVLLVSIPVTAWYWYTNYDQTTKTIIITEKPIATVTPPNITIKDQIVPITPPVIIPDINETELKIPPPEPIRQTPELPELHFAGHTYSADPAKRMIIINDTILREGGRVDENITLTEITWTGVILDYNGQQIGLVIE